MDEQDSLDAELQKDESTEEQIDPNAPELRHGQKYIGKREITSLPADSAYTLSESVPIHMISERDGHFLAKTIDIPMESDGRGATEEEAIANLGKTLVMFREDFKGMDPIPDNYQDIATQLSKYLVEK